MKINFFELAEKYNNHLIDENDAEYKVAEDALKELASTEDGKKELAEIVYEFIQKTIYKFDISPYIFRTKTFKATDNPIFKEKGFGMKAYWIAPNSVTPKSRNFDNQFTMEFDTVSVSPECHLDDITFGRVSSFAELMQDAKTAIEYAINEKVYTILKQAYNTVGNGGNGNYVTSSTALTEASLKQAIDAVRNKTNRIPVIIGSYTQMSKIASFTDFKALQLSDNAKDELRTTGLIGMYLGCKVIALANTKGENGLPTIPEELVFVTSDAVGFSATRGVGRVGQATNIDDWSWYAKIDLEKGWVITHPEYLYLIEIV